jgi:hypothetical protein
VEKRVQQDTGEPVHGARLNSPFDAAAAEQAQVDEINQPEERDDGQQDHD